MNGTSEKFGSSLVGLAVAGIGTKPWASRAAELTTKAKRAEKGARIVVTWGFRCSVGMREP